MQAELAPTPTLEAASPAKSRFRSWVGQLAGLLLLLATIHYVEPSALLARISQLHVEFIVVGTALVVPQLHCLALRWRLTAAQLGFPFAQRHALREYGLSMLLNLLLPFGVAGDALRVLRHSTGATLPLRAAREAASQQASPEHRPPPAALTRAAELAPSEHAPLREAPACSAVPLSTHDRTPLHEAVAYDAAPHAPLREALARDAAPHAPLREAVTHDAAPHAPLREVRDAAAPSPERAPGALVQAATTHVVGLSRAFHGVLLERMLGQIVVIVWAVATLPLWFGKVGVWLSLAALSALALSALLVRRIPPRSVHDKRSGPVHALLELSLALQQLLASRRYLTAQFALSSVITLSIAAQLYCALGALGLSLSTAQATQVFPLMLLSMSLPLAFAGFGPREAVTAELYDLLQLSAADGAAFALAFGAILICTSVPCLLLVLWLAEPEPEPEPEPAPGAQP